MATETRAAQTPGAEPALPAPGGGAEASRAPGVRHEPTASAFEAGAPGGADVGEDDQQPRALAVVQLARLPLPCSPRAAVRAGAGEGGPMPPARASGLDGR